MRRGVFSLVASLVLALSLALAGCAQNAGTAAEPPAASAASEDLGGEPAFTADELEHARENPGFESYSDLDELGRCGVAVACVGAETMPAADEERGSIGMVRPSGWQVAKYDFVDGRYLFNRCHLVGWQLGAENANEENLVTGTRSLNVCGMLPFENEVADYVHETGNHVLYRVTPHFEGDELVCRWVQIEALSLEDGGAGVSINVRCDNVEPGVGIDYATGDSWELPREEDPGSASEARDYVINTRSGVFHLPTCESVGDMKDKNREDAHATSEELAARGYRPCARCAP